ncbi:MAG: helix-turn-helix domain-containing protein [Desulfovibrionaceae bacterium]
MDLRELGALLREERERRGLTIDQVSDKIKITRTCIAAIEDGNEDCLPHPVYAKGFIKNYAKLLGMDNGEFQESLAQIYQSEETPLRDVPLLRGSDDEDTASSGAGYSSGQRLTVLLVAGVAVVVMVALGWYLYTAFFSKPASVTAPTATAPQVEQPTQPATPPVTPTVPVQTQEVPREPVQPAPSAAPAPAPEAAAPAPAVAPEAGHGASAPAVKPETPATAQPSAEDQATQDIAMSGVQNGSAPATVPNTPAAKQFAVGEHGSHMVRITATERCWLQAGADGGTMRESMLEPGDTFLGHFNDYLLVRLGNAGGVEIQFDGKVYPFRANKGSVKTLKFMGRNAGDTTVPPAENTGGTGKNAATGKVTPVAPQGEDKPAPTLTPTATDNPATTGETPAGGKELEVFGQDGSWVILMPDNGPAKEIYVKKGQRLTVPFGEKIDVKLGNPSKVVFRFDGKETPVTTERGEAKTLHFP